MIKPNNIFGNSLELNVHDALQLLEAGISEGLSTNLSFDKAVQTNIFGRRLHLFRSSGISSLAGMVATGLRGAALLDAPALDANRAALSSMVRERLPAVVHCIPGRYGYREYDFGDGGYFQLSSSSVQEAVDFSVLAHAIAERSLLPGLHVAQAPASAQMTDLPDLNILRQFLGRPDDHIPCPSPAQEILFGSQRRRIPNWFNFDHPTLHAARKSGRAHDLEAAAAREYFYRYLPGIIEQVFSDFANLTGWRYRAVQTHRLEKANFLILAMGPIYPAIAKVVDRLQEEEKARVACLRLNVIQPFPKAELARILQGRTGVTILEPVAGQVEEESPFFTAVRSLFDPSDRNSPELYYGQYGQDYTAESIEGAFKNMMKSGAHKRRYYLDIHFTLSKTSSPTHEILLQNIRRAYPDVEAKTLTGKGLGNNRPAETGKARSPLDVPMAIRRYEDKGPPYTRLARFYNDTAHFYETDHRGEVVADPFQALPTTPPATAIFSGVAAERESLPAFQPENCTACGACFVACPHAAIPAVALSAAALVKGAMQMASQRGTPVSKLTPLVRNLGKIAGKVIQEKANSIRTVADFLPEVFEKLLQQSRADEEKEKILREEFAIVTELIGDFPVSVTDPLFSQPEKQQAGGGELFSLAVDPHACTACGLCAEACADDALHMIPQTEERLMQTQATFQLWEQLPDTAGETISRLQQEPSYDPLAATLLSRNFYLSMNGGSRNDEGQSVKTLLHLVTAVTESVVQPQLNKQLKTIEKLTGDLAGNINKILTKALPSSDFDGIAAALNRSETPRLPLDELIGKFDAEEHLDLLDTGDLQRKIALYNDLQQLQQTLQSGPTGLGRARYGLVLTTKDLPWAPSYPENAFTTPVILQTGDGSPEKIQGLLRGHIRHLLDNIRLLRRAQLEIRNKYEPDQHDETIASLSWADLDDNEKELIPPILLIGTARQLTGADSGPLFDLLTKEWPVKVILLNTGPNPGADEENLPAFPESGALLSLLAGRTAFVLQSCLADHRHFFEGLLKGMLSPRPALFHLFAADNHLLASRSRTFPFFRFDPDTEGAFLSSALDLNGNPALESDWHSAEVEYQWEDALQKVIYQYTPADLLYQYEDWRKYFEPYRPADGEGVPVAEFIKLDKRTVTGKTPIVLVKDADGVVTPVKVAAPVLSYCRATLQYWNSLRELAGERTPYPQRVREETEAELKATYDRQLAQLRSEYEEKLQKKEAELMQEVKIRLREKLLRLSAQK